MAYTDFLREPYNRITLYKTVTQMERSKVLVPVEECWSRLKWGWGWWGKLMGASIS